MTVEPHPSPTAVERHRALLDHLPGTSVAAFDDELRLETLTGRGLIEAGWSPRAREGQPLAAVVPAEQAGALAELCRRALGGEPGRLEHCSEADGRRLELSFVPVRERDGRVSRVMVLATDVHERRELEERLRRLAGQDDLTGLLNRRRFGEELERHLALSARHGGRAALLLLDLDGLKAVNDTRGHAAGDELLRRTARAMAARLRGSDVLARFGGDEFAVLVVPSGPEQARRVGEALRRAVREGAGASASVGGVLTGTGLGREELLAAADGAMYEAKRRGGDAVVLRAA